MIFLRLERLIINRMGKTMNIQFTDNSKEVLEAMQQAAVPALWVVVNVSSPGTIDDPIPAARGMEYEYGKYYLDPEDGKTYLCKRGEETGSIVLYYLPHELVGNYFEET